MLKKMQVDVQIPDDFYSEAVKLEIADLKAANLKLKKQIKRLESQRAHANVLTDKEKNELEFLKLNQQKWVTFRESFISVFDLRGLIQDETNDQERY